MADANLLDMLRRSGGIEAVSKQLGLAPGVAAQGVEALLPALVGGFAKRGEAAGGGEAGLGALVGVLGGLGGGALAANVLGPDETDPGRGNAVLGEVFGSKEVSRSVAADAAARTGIDAQVLKRMLPLLAMLVGGYLSARAGGSGAQGSGGLGGLGSLLGSVLGDKQGGGLGGIGSLLDMDGDGNPLDDIIGLGRKFIA
ncbi:MAG: hypothetical protein RL702_3007 [Pseudomonadota bacterium]|jgi:hypothetical protein|nr:DUF937 domain-containing protein [Novosphingobium sp.]HOA49304.1 DUF937 domain-containing protein [Novosphingobium sp.]HPB21209.1 DUF937 domain-containing protein [Novosphingobium sp.]HPZ45865.1 DUF937 domain-containing protein [Novosphingobium sp.]HQD98753.1 DUF937 domain-containing protein [Novosphingobium sp.]